MAGDILTADGVESVVSKIKGTWVKRRNARKRLIAKSNAEVMEQISICKGKIRDLRAMGAREQDLRYWYAEVTKLEIKLLWVHY